MGRPAPFGCLPLAGLRFRSGCETVAGDMLTQAAAVLHVSVRACCIAPHAPGETVDLLIAATSPEGIFQQPASLRLTFTWFVCAS